MLTLPLFDETIGEHLVQGGASEGFMRSCSTMKSERFFTALAEISPVWLKSRVS